MKKGSHMTVEQKAKISETLMGHIVLKEVKNKISMSLVGRHIGLDNHNFGKAMSKEQKEKIRKALLGRKLSNEQRMRISKTLLGRKLSTEHKANLSRALTGLSLGINHWNYGKHLAVETKKKNWERKFRKSKNRGNEGLLE